MHFSTFHPIFHKTFQPFSFIIAHVSIDSLLVRFTICHILTINTASFVLFSLFLSKLSSQPRPLFNWFVYINNSCFNSYLPHFSLINAFFLNCRWVNLSDIYWSIHLDNNSQFSLFYYLTMCSNISSFSAIYRIYNSTVFKCIVGTLFAIIIQLFAHIYLFHDLSVHFRWETVFFYHFVSHVGFHPVFNISRISRMLVRIWESQFSSV